MPVWGEDLLSETPEVPEKEWAKTVIIESIADYLIAIQPDSGPSRRESPLDPDTPGGAAP